MTPNHSYGNLTESYRLTGKERAAINHMRGHLKMSMNHIAEVLNRSTATIHKALECSQMLKEFDNRGGKPRVRDTRIKTFNDRKTRIRLAIRAFVTGLAPSVGEAIQLAFSQRGFGELPISENSPDEDDSDPA